MAIFFGRVKKSDFEHTASFANIVPVYMRDSLHHDGPEVVTANGVPDWLFYLVNWLVCSLPMPYEGFMFSRVKPIEQSEPSL